MQPLKWIPDSRKLTQFQQAEALKEMEIEAQKEMKEMELKAEKEMKEMELKAEKDITAAKLAQDNKHLEAEKKMTAAKLAIQKLFVIVFFFSVVVFSTAIKDGLLGNNFNSTLKALEKAISEVKNSLLIKAFVWTKVAEGFTNIAKCVRPLWTFVTRLFVRA